MHSTEQEQDVEVNLGGIADKSLRQQAINVINSFAGELTEEEFISELSALDQITEEEKIERYERNLAAQYRRLFGTFKTKGNRQIQESLSEQMTFCLPLDEGGVVELQTGAVIPFRYADKKSLREHRDVNKAKRAAKRAVLDAADDAEERSVNYIVSNMAEGATLGDYADENGYAVL